jgi:hypothetical protein
LVPVGDSSALADAVIELLDDEEAMNQMRRKAYVHTRGMVWPTVAQDYLRLFDRVAGWQPAIPAIHAGVSLVARPADARNGAMGTWRK